MVGQFVEDGASGGGGVPAFFFESCPLTLADQPFFGTILGFPSREVDPLWSLRRLKCFSSNGVAAGAMLSFGTP